MPKTTKKTVAQSTTKAKKPVTHKKAATKHAKAEGPRSFRLYTETKPFLTPLPTVQSFYWLIIGVLVLLLAGWAMYLTVQIQGIYDTITPDYVKTTITTKQ